MHHQRRRGKPCEEIDFIFHITSVIAPRRLNRRLVDDDNFRYYWRLNTKFREVLAILDQCLFQSRLDLRRELWRPRKTRHLTSRRK